MLPAAELWSYLVSMLLGAFLNAILIASITAIIADLHASERCVLVNHAHALTTLAHPRPPHRVTSSLHSGISGSSQPYDCSLPSVYTLQGIPLKDGPAASVHEPHGHPGRGAAWGRSHPIELQLNYTFSRTAPIADHLSHSNSRPNPSRPDLDHISSSTPFP